MPIVSRFAAALFAVFLLVLAIATVPACAADPQKADTVVTAWNEIVKDGTITPQEADRFATILREQIGVSEEINWPATIGAGVASIVTSFLGLNAYRNSRERKVWGPPPAEGAGSGTSPGTSTA